MRNPSRTLKLEMDSLQVETFAPASPLLPGDDAPYYMDPGVTGGEMTCVQHTCNACTFTCWAC
ncbi:MAG TPA: hypothetical protein VFR37_06035 [Longimicrobium sp.]|nr:hypothetical protein [Longimicrobium sp.]